MSRPKLFVVVDPSDAHQVALERALITGPKQDPLPELYVSVGTGAAGSRQSTLPICTW